MIVGHIPDNNLKKNSIRKVILERKNKNKCVSIRRGIFSVNSSRRRKLKKKINLLFSSSFVPTWMRCVKPDRLTTHHAHLGWPYSLTPHHTLNLIFDFFHGIFSAPRKKQKFYLKEKLQNNITNDRPIICTHTHTHIDINWVLSLHPFGYQTTTIHAFGSN